MADTLDYIMPVTFNNILLPVDFSINTEVAVKKTIDLIEETKPVVCLYHIVNPFPQNILKLNRLSDKNTIQYRQAKEKLLQWQNSIQEIFPYIEVRTEIESGGKIEKRIIKKANTMMPDLIVIGQKTRHSWFHFLNTISVNKVAIKSDCPVLTVTPESMRQTIKSIVMPVGGFVPKRKIELIAALRRKFRIRVYLVTGKGTGNKQFSPDALLETYGLVKQFIRGPLEYRVLHSDNFAKAALEFADEIHADMVLMDPEKESGFAPFHSRNTNDFIHKNPQLQILTVN